MAENAAEFVQGLLHNILGGDIPLVSEWLSDLFTNEMSTFNDFVFPGYPGRSRGAAHKARYNTLLTSYSRRSGKRVREQMRREGIETIVRALDPGASDIDVEGAISNVLSPSQLAYEFLDPYGMKAGVSAANTLTSDMVRGLGGFGLTQQMPETIRGVNRLLYGDKNIIHRVGDRTPYDKDIGYLSRGLIYDITHNSAAYGGLSVSDVMTVGRELFSANQERYRGLTGEGQGGNALKNFETGAGEFRKDLQEITKAMAPWKDVLGTDMPRLLNQLEGLTGQALSGNMTTLARTGYKLSATMSQTGASIEAVAAYRDTVAKTLMDPTGYNRGILGAHNVAMDLILGTANASGSVGMLTTAEFQQAAGKFYSGTAKSDFAERYAQAFAQWSSGRSGMSLEDAQKQFEEEYNRQLQTTGSADAALLRITGSKSLTDLEMYRGTDAYVYAMKQGLGAGASRSTFLNSAMQYALSKYAADTAGNAVSQSINTALSGLSNEERQRFFSLNKSEKSVFLRNLKDAKGNPLINATDEELIKNVTMLEGAIKLGAGAYGYSGTEAQVQTLYKTGVEERRRAANVEREMQFRRVYDMSADAGGLAGVFQKARKAWSGGNEVKLSDALKTYFHMDDKGLGGLVTAEGLDDQGRATAAAYIMRNLDTISESAGLTRLYSDLTGNDKSRRDTAARAFAAIGGMDLDLSGLSTEMVEEFVAASEGTLDEKGMIKLLGTGPGAKVAKERLETAMRAKDPKALSKELADIALDSKITASAVDDIKSKEYSKKDRDAVRAWITEQRQGTLESADKWKESLKDSNLSADQKRLAGEVIKNRAISSGTPTDMVAEVLRKADELITKLSNYFDKKDGEK